MARTLTLKDARGAYAVEIADDGRVRVDGGEPVLATAFPDGSVALGEPFPRTAWVAASGDARWVFLDGQVFRFEVESKGTRRHGGTHHGTLSAPMPATVLRVLVEAGAEVKRGDTLIILEAMKMELPIRAGADGVVTAVGCREGELVQPGTSLIEIDEAGS